MPTDAPGNKDHRAPGPIEPTRTFHFPSGDGTRLYGEFFAAPNPRARALIVHGYAEHCGRYRELAHVLVRAGVSALSYDMRGHGRANGQRGHIDTIADYLDDLDAARAELARQATAESGLPSLLIGHSNGGLIVLRALADPVRAPQGITTAVVSSPFLAFNVPVSRAKDLLGRVAGKLVPRLSLPSEISIEALTSDRDKQRERQLDTLCHDVASARWYTATLEAQDYVAEFAARIPVPSLWLVAGKDRLANPAASHIVHARLRAPSQYHAFADMRHEVFNERDRGRVFGVLEAYIDKETSH